MWEKLMSDLVDVYLDYARQINFGLLVLIIAGLTANMVVRRDKMIRRTRRILMWIYLIFLNFVYGTAVNIHDHIQVKPPVIVATALLVGLLLAIIWTPQGDEKRPPEDGAIGTRFALWLDKKVVNYKARHGRIDL